MKKILVFLAVLMMIGAAGSASASKIEYTDANLGGGRYALVFDVFNESLSDAIEWFSIYFPDGSFTGFSPDANGVGPETQPAGWVSYSFEPSAIDLQGQFNSDRDSASGIATGSHLDGFTVTFNRTGVGSYDGLYYEVGYFDGSGDYLLSGDGYTEKKNQIPGVPEPGTMALLFAGLAGLGFIKKRMTTV
jgi:hypothetical protein